jgi:hypothetical protein
MPDLNQRELTVKLSYNDHDQKAPTSFYVDFETAEGMVLGSLKISEGEAVWLSKSLNVKILQ